MPTLWVEQQVERDALLGAAAVQPERVAVTAHEPDALVGGHAAERAAPLGEQHEPGVARQVARLVEVDRLLAKSRSMSAPSTSSSAMPVQPDSTASSARYSSAVQPDAPTP